MIHQHYLSVLKKNRLQWYRQSCFSPWHKGIWEEYSYSSTHLNLSTKLRWVVNFKHWLLYPDKELLHVLNSRLYILQSKPGHCGEEKNILPLPGFEPWIILALWRLNGNEYSTVGDQVLNTPLLTVHFFFLNCTSNPLHVKPQFEVNVYTFIKHHHSSNKL
jgi:hypothetical protein